MSCSGDDAGLIWDEMPNKAIVLLPLTTLVLLSCGSEDRGQNNPSPYTDCKFLCDETVAEEVHCFRFEGIDEAATIEMIRQTGLSICAGG